MVNNSFKSSDEICSPNMNIRKYVFLVYKVMYNNKNEVVGIFGSMEKAEKIQKQVQQSINLCKSEFSKVTSVLISQIPLDFQISTPDDYVMRVSETKAINSNMDKYKNHSKIKKNADLSKINLALQMLDI